MKTLILMRHAKSGWDTPASDQERRLNERGRKSATALGTWMHDAGLQPDTILCSSAHRTIETTDRLKLHVQYTPTRALYLASSDQTLTQIQMAQADTLLVVGHNPGIGDLAERLANTLPEHPAFGPYPTGATTVFACGIDQWADLKPGSAQIKDFIVPRDLIP